MRDSDQCRTKWLAFLRLSEKNLDQSVFCSRCTDCKFLLVFSAFLWFFLPFSEKSATGVLVPLKEPYQVYTLQVRSEKLFLNSCRSYFETPQISQKKILPKLYHETNSNILGHGKPFSNKIVRDTFFIIFLNYFLQNRRTGFDLL